MKTQGSEVLRSALLCSAVLSFARPAALLAEDFVWENATARLAISATAEARVTVDKNEGLLPEKAHPFMAVVKDGKNWAATSAQLQENSSDIVDFLFGDSDVKARLRVTVQPLYFLVELIAVDPAVEKVEFVNLSTHINDRVGNIVNAVWDDERVVCVMGLSPQVESRGMSAAVHRKFGVDHGRAAIIALPTQQFYEGVQRVERDHGLPSPTLNGQWAKISEDSRRSYLFTDLTERNVDETIRWAKLGGFGYILIFDSTWASSRGMYPINLANYPSGERSLKAVVEKCHAAGVKVGIHCLTSFVAKRDRLASPVPDPRLLKDRTTNLGSDITAEAGTIPATDAVSDWPVLPSVSLAPDRGAEFQIDDEIIGYEVAGGPDGKTFVQCKRGINGTRAAPHERGAKIAHLAQLWGVYFADLRTSLMDEMAERLAAVVNRCELDMIYFDGAASNKIMGPEEWYWVSAPQFAVWRRLRREVLVEGAGRTHWTWHFYTRGVCSDYAMIAPKTYLDYYKIPMWDNYHANFLPAHLGWWGLVGNAPDHPATTPDEVELYAVRMMALDSPIAMQSDVATLQKNARAEEMVRLLGQYETVRLAHKLPADFRNRLRHSEWQMVPDGAGHVFRPVNFEALRLDTPGVGTLHNPRGRQPLAFRLRAEPCLANAGDPRNRVLFRPASPLDLETPPPKAFICGMLGKRLEFAKAAGDQPEAMLVGPEASLGSGPIKGYAPDLSSHRALAVQLEVDGPPPSEGEPPPVLNVQLEGANLLYRDHHIDLDFRGEKTVVLPNATPDRTLREFHPETGTYAAMLAVRGFNYRQVAALNFRWMRGSAQSGLRVTLRAVEALRESDAALRNPAITVRDATMEIPINLRTGDYLEFSGAGDVHVFGADGERRSKAVRPLGPPPMLYSGANEISMRAQTSSPVNLTVIIKGEPLKP